MKNHTLHRIAFALFSVAALVFVSPTRADDAGDIQQLQKQIQALQDRLNVLARKQELADEATAAAAKSQIKTTVSDNGLVVATPDAANSFHVGALVQFDSREFFGDGGGVANNGFFLRRARIVLDGKLDKIYSWQFVPEFGNGSGGTATAVAILDANVTIQPTSAVGFKFGKYKTPIGLEELQNDPATTFTERSLLSNLLPNRDLGAAFVGSLGQGAVSYTLGVFNGIPDALTSSGNSDFDNDKDLDGRVFVTPFINDKDSPLQGLGFGVGGSSGREKTHSAATSGYKTDGQQTFFTYNTAVYADGQVWRLSPQAYYYAGPFSLLGEYAVSTINLRPTAPTATVFTPKVQVENKAYEVTAGYFLTGEDASYGAVTPSQPFSWTNGTWGGLQLVARYADLKIDPAAFRGATPLASPVTNANEASVWGLGLNWYLTKAVRISQDFYDTEFHIGTLTSATPQILQHNEEALTTRVQISF